MDGTDPFFLTLESRWHWMRALCALVLAAAAWLLRRDTFFRKEVEAALADPSYNTQLEGLRGLEIATRCIEATGILGGPLLWSGERPAHGSGC
jgi:hypothetical protein